MLVEDGGGGNGYVYAVVVGVGLGLAPVPVPGIPGIGTTGTMLVVVLEDGYGGGALLGRDECGGREPLCCDGYGGRGPLG